MAASDEETEKVLLKSYLDAWRRIAHQEKTKRMRSEQREKLDQLIQTMKRYKEKQRRQQQISSMEVKAKEPLNNYKNRFDAQKNIIEKLTLKLEEKNHLIEELKLGVFDQQALKSLNQTKIEIREIFANCSARTRNKLPPPPDYNEKFMISTQKAPKIIQEMEERAFERARRREIILERKRIIEENRQKMIAELLEKKRVQDEEETKRNLERIKEQRRKDMERRKIRETNKAIFLEKLEVAIGFHSRKLLNKSFKALYDNHKQSKENYCKSVTHFRIGLFRKVFNQWREFIEDKYKAKNATADAVFNKNILTKVMNSWTETRMEGVRSMQVAEDFYDLLLLNNTFVRWHRHICVQAMLLEKKIKTAEKHDNQRILFHYFYLWRTLPAVIQLERSKEEKKKKWRAKVWEIVPDYKPPADDDLV